MSPTDVDLTSIIVNYNTRHLLRPCLDALRASVAAAGLSHQIVVVENGSRDGSVEALASECEGCETIVNRVNVGFGRANNQALAIARGRRVLLLNTDAFVAVDSIAASVRYLDEHPRLGLVGVRLIGSDGELQPSCRYFPTPYNEFLARTGLGRILPSTRMVDDLGWPHDAPRLCDWVTGCFYLLRREAIDAVGLFDPRYFLYYEEVDHCRALKAAGWEVAFFPGTSVVHIGGESAKSDAVLTSGRQISGLQIESGLLYFRKHHGLAGALLAGVLATIGDAVLAMKWIVRQRSLPAGAWRHSQATWHAMRQTAFGSRPTR
jgi:hypothetical protein